MKKHKTKKHIQKAKKLKLNKSRALQQSNDSLVGNPLSLIIVIIYLFLTFQLEKPYMIFFMAPLFFTLMSGAFKSMGRKLNDKEINL